MKLAIIGGGALILSGVHVRPTEDIDVVAQWDGDWQPGSPLPQDVIEFVRAIGLADDLPVKVKGKGTDWLNAAPSLLMPDDLPPGFFDRTTAQRFGALTLHVPAATDLTALKLLAATRAGRGTKRQQDLQDLVKLAPSGDELAKALRWVSTRPPTEDFWPTRCRSLLDELAAAGLGEAVAAASALLPCHGDAS